jgi:hypothetical protein
MNSGATIHYLEDFAEITNVLSKKAEVFLYCNNTGNTLSQGA